MTPQPSRDVSADAATSEAAAATDTADATMSEGMAPTFTSEQVALGKTAYDANCVSCHGPDLISANYGPPLAGAYFDGKWRGQSVAALYTHTHDGMPPSRPARLSSASLRCSSTTPTC